MLEKRIEEFKKIAALGKKRGGEYALIANMILNFLRDPKDQSFLEYCAINGKIKLLTQCAQSGVDLSVGIKPQKRGKRGTRLPTLVDIARQNGHEDCAKNIEELIKKQKDVSLQLFEAVKKGRVRTTGEGPAQQLSFDDCLNQGAIIDARDRLATTPLMIACEKGRTDMVRKLIEAGADVNARDRLGATPLMWASYGNKVEILELLINAGAKVNAKDKENGSTPLIWWATNSKDNVEGLKFLIRHGAGTRTQIKPTKMEERDHDEIIFGDMAEWFAKKRETKEVYFDDDRYAVDFARTIGNLEIVDYLEKYEERRVQGIISVD